MRSQSEVDEAAEHILAVHKKIYGATTEINNVFAGGNVGMMFIATALEHIAGAIQIVAVAMDDRNRIMRRQCEAMELQSQTMAEFAKSQKEALDEIRPAEPQRDSADAERPARSDVQDRG